MESWRHRFFQNWHTPELLKGLSEDNLTDTVVNRFQIRVAGRPFQRKEYPFSKQTDTSGRDLSFPFPEQLKFKAAFD